MAYDIAWETRKSLKNGRDRLRYDWMYQRFGSAISSTPAFFTWSVCDGVM